jgi:hypothetical protein
VEAGQRAANSLQIAALLDCGEHLREREGLDVVAADRILESRWKNGEIEVGTAGVANLGDRFWGVAAHPRDPIPHQPGSGRRQPKRQRRDASLGL